ncbi:MAG TPA: hypothetical protein VMW42_04365 [Desulfatiglandales bacterium]|nr:hypothetical protein [Desulfatiglandales bacterium]
MQQPELNQEICTFCSELSGQTRISNYFRLVGHSAKSRIIWKNSEFALIPSLGSLVEGHMLLIPTYHAFSFANLPITSLESAENLIASIMRFFGENGQQVLVFEHGAVILAGSDYEKRVKRARCGACTDHAHIHILPSVSPELVVSKIERMRIHMNRTVLENLGKLRGQVDPALPYIFIGGSDIESWLIFMLEYVPSQFMRKLVSSSIGLTEWDWRQFPRINLVQKTIQEIGPRLNEWLQSNS